MADVFISYSRKDSAFVRRLHEALTAAGRDSWVDWEDIPPTAQWLSEIYAAVEAADAFVFIISPDSLASKVCGEEVAHAVQHNKRIIPLLYRPPDDTTHIDEAIASHNWIYCRDSDDFDAALQTLNTALDTDLSYVRAHTRLLVRAREWENRDRNASYLLRGQDLNEAEAWLGSSSGKDPEPANLQTAYILSSRQAANARQRMTVGALTGGLLLALVLAAFALVQWNSASIARATAIAEADNRATQERIALDNAVTATIAQGRAEIEADNAATAAAEAIAAQNIAEAEAQARATAQANAEEQARIAVSGQLAAQALNQLDERLDLALILSAQAYDTANTLEARKSLLTALTNRPQVVTYMRDHLPDGIVSAVAASPDGRLIASGDDAGRVILWDAMTGQRLFPRPFAHVSRVIGLGFTADSQRLHSVDQRGNMMTWDTMTGDRNGWPREEGRFDGFLEAAFSPAGDKVALAAGLTNNIRIYDTQTGEALTPNLTGYSNFVESMAFSPDGRYLIATDLYMNIRLWNTTTGEEIDRTFPKSGDSEGFASGIAFSPDGQRVAMGGITQFLSIWDLETGALVNTIESAEQLAADGISYSPDGSLIAVGGHRGGVLLVDAETLDTRSVIPVHSQQIDSLAFIDAHQLVTLSPDGTLALINLAAAAPLAHVLNHEVDAAGDVAFSPDGSSLVTARCIERLPDRSCPRRELTIWNTTTGERRNQTYEYPAGATAVAYSPDGSRLAVIDSNYQVQLIDAATLQPLPDLLPMPEADDTGEGAINALVFSPDGRFLAGSGIIDTLLLWDLESGVFIGQPLVDPDSEEARFAPVQATWSVAFSADSRWLATGGINADITIWDVATVTRQTVLSLDDSATVSALAFSPEGRTLAAGNFNGEIALWDLNLERLVGQPLVGHTGLIEALDFEPAGAVLVSSGQDGNALLWDVASGQPLGPALNRPEMFVYDVEFSADGRWLAMGARDELSMWDMTAANWSGLACQRGQLNFSLPEWQQMFPDRPYAPVCPHSAAGLADLTERADLLALAGDTDKARELYLIATGWVLQTTDDRESTSICHDGVINGFAVEVMPACEHAVEYNPTYGPRHSERGVARALTGDTEGAITDFELFLDWLDDFQAANAIFFGDQLYPIMGEPRVQWIAELKAGNNPFDAETLVSLRDQ